jgi:toxin-antitoxin system PIN domain toxin
MHLLDVNVWLALAFDSHQHHQPAVAWFSAAQAESCCFCRVTQLGFLRLATTPRVMTDRALTLQEAWLAYDAFYNDPRVVFADEPEDLEPVWRTYTQHNMFSPKVWNDAYLAALAHAAGFELVTFDKGFAQYKNVNCTILS